MIAAWYAHLYVSMEKTAWREGYCLALHGSMNRDLDLVACPWTDDAGSPDDLVEALCKKHGLKRGYSGDQNKPHGRICYTFHLWDSKGLFAGNFYIDLSIMPRCG